jgi:UDP-N-acetylmuramoylalanine-D-glutamate ligase
MEVLDCTNKYCIVGAGSSGLAAAKNLKAHQISRLNAALRRSRAFQLSPAVEEVDQENELNQGRHRQKIRNYLDNVKLKL